MMDGYSQTVLVLVDDDNGGRSELFRSCSQRGNDTGDNKGKISPPVLTLRNKNKQNADF
jgi:hypothetical protein